MTMNSLPSVFILLLLSPYYHGSVEAFCHGRSNARSIILRRTPSLDCIIIISSRRRQPQPVWTSSVSRHNEVKHLDLIRSPISFALRTFSSGILALLGWLKLILMQLVTNLRSIFFGEHRIGDDHTVDHRVHDDDDEDVVYAPAYHDCDGAEDREWQQRLPPAVTTMTTMELRAREEKEKIAAQAYAERKLQEIELLELENRQKIQNRENRRKARETYAQRKLEELSQIEKLNEMKKKPFWPDSAAKTRERLQGQLQQQQQQPQHESLPSVDPSATTIREQPVSTPGPGQRSGKASVPTPAPVPAPLAVPVPAVLKIGPPLVPYPTNTTPHEALNIFFAATDRIGPTRRLESASVTVDPGAAAKSPHVQMTGIWELSERRYLPHHHSPTAHESSDDPHRGLNSSSSSSSLGMSFSATQHRLSEPLKDKITLISTGTLISELSGSRGKRWSARELSAQKADHSSGSHITGDSTTEIRIATDTSDSNSSDRSDNDSNIGSNSDNMIIDSNNSNGSNDNKSDGGPSESSSSDGSGSTSVGDPSMSSSRCDTEGDEEIELQVVRGCTFTEWVRSSGLPSSHVSSQVSVSEGRVPLAQSTAGATGKPTTTTATGPLSGETFTAKIITPPSLKEGPYDQKPTLCMYRGRLLSGGRMIKGKVYTKEVLAGADVKETLAGEFTMRKV